MMKNYAILLSLVIVSHMRGDLIRPENGTILNHIYVLFEWEQVPEADHYEIQIAENSGFSNPLVHVDDNTLAYVEKDEINWNNTYYWRIRSVYNSGSVGPWTESFSFTTGYPLSETTTTVVNESQIQTGLTVFGVFFNYFSAVVNQTGKEVWNSGDENIVYYSTSEYGDVFGCYLLFGADNNLPGIELSFDGGTIWEEPNQEFLHHDMIQLPNGNYLGIVETSSMGAIPYGSWTSLFQGLGVVADGVTIEFPWVGDKLVEWDEDTKDVVWSWNVFDYFNMSDYDQFGGTWIEAYQSLHYDWTHVNSVIFDEEESAIYISTRHLSRITKIDYPSGDIIWNMGHQLASGDVDMGTEIGFSFQHSLQKLDNGNILTFDNGNLAPEFRGTDVQISRAIEVSTDGNSASLVWEYELPTDLFGFASGNAQKLENGNVMVTTVGGGGRSLEVNADGDVVWDVNYNLSLPNGAVYRAHRIPGIFPAAFSVLIDHYMEGEGDEGVYLPAGSSDISFTLYNEGDYSLSLSYQLSDNEGWFGSQSGDLTLDLGESGNLSFTGSVSAIGSGNTITLVITPEHHPERSKIISVNGFTSPLGTGDEIILNSFKLEKPFPNPFNPTATIHFSIETMVETSLQIYNIKGQWVETLFKSKGNPGQHEIQWNAKNYSSGLYFVNLVSGAQSQTQKVLYLK